MKKSRDPLIDNAKEFLLEARDAYRNRRFLLVCFLSHQAAEFALRALATMIAEETEYSENLLNYLDFLATKGMVIPDDIYAFSEALSQHFMNIKCLSRAGMEYTENQALRCIAYAEAILSFVEKEVQKRSS